ncbi:MAG: hypothetical protein WCE62_18480 [Polyangiales bacterium]
MRSRLVGRSAHELRRRQRPSATDAPRPHPATVPALDPINLEILQACFLATAAVVALMFWPRELLKVALYVSRTWAAFVWCSNDVLWTCLIAYEESHP